MHFQKSKPSFFKASNKTLKIVHITDIHYDPKYVVGSLVDCDKTICCRDVPPENSTEETAGQWGDYNYCGSPWKSIVDALEQIKVEHSVSILLLFGLRKQYFICRTLICFISLETLLITLFGRLQKKATWKPLIKLII